MYVSYTLSICKYLPAAAGAAGVVAVVVEIVATCVVGAPCAASVDCQPLFLSNCSLVTPMSHKHKHRRRVSDHASNIVRAIL